LAGFQVSTFGRFWVSPEAPRFDASLADLIAAVRAQGLEGLVAKRLDSVYEPCTRSGAWRKMRSTGRKSS
jgi:bifunctional non-homologous end joining protein LigD